MTEKIMYESETLYNIHSAEEGIFLEILFTPRKLYRYMGFHETTLNYDSADCSGPCRKDIFRKACEFLIRQGKIDFLRDYLKNNPNDEFNEIFKTYDVEVIGI